MSPPPNTLNVVKQYCDIEIVFSGETIPRVIDDAIQEIIKTDTALAQKRNLN
ncbi:unnamed protein product, partial [Rotaria sp. Silwood1]